MLSFNTIPSFQFANEKQRKRQSNEIKATTDFVVTEENVKRYLISYNIAERRIAQTVPLTALFIYFQRASVGNYLFYKFQDLSPFVM